MAGITLEQAQAQLDAALQAALGVKGEKEVFYQGRRVTAHDQDQINRDIEFWDGQVKRLSAEASYGTRSGRVRSL